MSSNYSPASPTAKAIAKSINVTYNGAGTGTMTTAAVFDLSGEDVSTITGVSVSTTDLTWSARSGLVINPVCTYVNGATANLMSIADQTAGSGLFFNITSFNYNPTTKQLTVNISYTGESPTTVNTNSGNPSMNVIAFGQ